MARKDQGEDIALLTQKLQSESAMRAEEQRKYQEVIRLVIIFVIKIRILLSK